MLLYDPTLIICQLRDGSAHQGTVTSMEPNEGSFVLHSETTKVNWFPFGIALKHISSMFCQ